MAECATGDAAMTDGGRSIRSARQSMIGGCERRCDRRRSREFLDGLNHSRSADSSRSGISVDETNRAALPRKSRASRRSRLLDLVPPETPTDLEDRSPLWAEIRCHSFTHLREALLSSCQGRRRCGRPGRARGLQLPGHVARSPGQATSWRSRRRQQVGEFWSTTRDLPDHDNRRLAGSANRTSAGSRDSCTASWSIRLRRVSEHVTIGSAARNGRDLGSWFVRVSSPLLELT